MITGIIVALSEELSTLKTVPNALWERCMIRGKFIFLTDDIILIYAGAGAENAQKATELAVSKGATKLISWGCAAALSPDLKMGDLVLADSLLNSNGLEIAVNATWHQHVKTVLGSDIVAYKGALFNSNVLISTATEKQAIYAKTGAIALDMESDAIAQVAQHYALPFLAIRAIADPAMMDLPTSVSKALNENGEIEITKIIASLVFNPKEIKHLIQLGQYFQLAKRTLSNVAKKLPDLIDL
ncbi:purine phosphorylase [Methylococcaceae bacterium]|nr:purine phosphorylase [Methylococcaceae bacterium]